MGQRKHQRQSDWTTLGGDNYRAVGRTETRPRSLEEKSPVAKKIRLEVNFPLNGRPNQIKIISRHI